VVQQNAALVSESAEAAQSMADQATELVDSVARFKLDSDAEAQPEPEDQPEPPQLVVEAPARREPALQAPGQVLSHLRLNARK
jgi:methyl-accepting chemotaxis protein